MCSTSCWVFKQVIRIYRYNIFWKIRSMRSSATFENYSAKVRSYLRKQQTVPIRIFQFDGNSTKSRTRTTHVSSKPPDDPSDVARPLISLIKLDKLQQAISCGICPYYMQTPHLACTRLLTCADLFTSLTLPQPEEHRTKQRAHKHPIWKYRSHKQCSAGQEGRHVPLFVHN